MHFAEKKPEFLQHVSKNSVNIKAEQYMKCSHRVVHIHMHTSGGS